MKICRDSAAARAEAVRILRAGGVVAAPTETVYGLFADALRADACGRLFAIKGRPLIDPLIVHVADMEGVERLAEVPGELDALAGSFWPGPLTVVLRKRAIVPDVATAGLPTVGVRMPRHPLIRELLRESGLALAGPSANPFGYVSPTRAEHVRDSLGERAGLVLDGGPCAIGLESTVLDMRAPSRPAVLRPGAITVEMLSEVLGVEVIVNSRQAGARGQAGLPSPGLMERHYSPRTPLRVVEAGGEIAARGRGREAAALFSRDSQVIVPEGVERYWLTESGDAEEAAREVFALLRRLDGMGFERVHVEAAPEGGLGTAINDRLRRAAGEGGRP